jgi:hypothetical protein
MAKYSTRRFIYYQLAILAAFLALTLLNEAVDVPHLVFGDPPIAPVQRRGEMGMEIFFALLIFAIELMFIQKLRKDIRVLEGFIPICASCKKVRSRDHWEPVEKYIKSHSLADFTHSVCPECLEKLYPQYAKKILKKQPPPSSS